MRLKSLILIAVAVSVLGIVGCDSSPKAVTQKQSEGTLESIDDSPASGAFTGLARTQDGHLLAIVKDNKKIGILDPLKDTSVHVFESSDKEWIYSPSFSPDGSMLATVSNTPRNFQSSGHLLLWDPATGQRLASVDNLSWPICCANF